MQNNPRAMQELFQIISSPTGQQLIAHLKKSGGNDLESAIAKAAEGKFDDAKKIISTLLEDPEAKKLWKQLGG